MAVTTTVASPVASTPKKLGWRQYSGYATGDAANNLAFAMASSFLLLNYTNVVGLGGAAIGTMFLLIRFWDAFADLFAAANYDFYQLVAQNDAQWAFAKAPVPGAGLDHAAQFARNHGKGMWLGEWGVHSTQGPGDNPFFMKKMWEWCVANSDILVGENYFSEPDAYIACAIWNPSGSPQNPNSAKVWRDRWGRPDLYPNGAA